MIYPDVDVKKWCEKYGIEEGKSSAQNAGKISPLILQQQGVQGLVSMDHGCGKGYSPSMWVPVGDEREEWNGIFKGEIEND